MGLSDRPTESSPFAGLFARGGAVPETGQVALLQAMLDFEVALLRALARAGRAPAAAAAELAGVADASTFDLAELGRCTAEHGTPVPGILSALRARVEPATATYLHLGATSQDVVDTAIMLVARRALASLLRELDEAAAACARLADEHRHTLLPGRTLLQQAVPITFGLKAANWLTGLDGVCEELRQIRERELAVQLGGAVGTLAALGDGAFAIVADVADQLGLADPGSPWHTIRLRPARLACALGAALGVMAKIARDVVLSAQAEVAEVAEAAGGGSSTMPHKHNPVAAIAVLACAQRSPGLVATMLAAMVQEHERAAGAWQAEAETMLELLRLTASAAASLKESLAGLAVDPAQMRANLERGGGLIMSESVVGALSHALGRSAARQLVERAARDAREQRRGLREVLLDVPEARDALGASGLERALDPGAYLGASGELIDRALARHIEAAKRQGEEEPHAGRQL